MLSTYQLRTQQLLQYPAASAQQIYSVGDINTWINIARGQLAGETECCRTLGNLVLTIGVRDYNFSAITFAAGSGLGGIINVRQMLYAVASGYQWMRPRPWAWYWFYRLNNPVPTPGAPEEWSQFSQGSSSLGPVGTGPDVSGSFYVAPVPDLTYSLLIDCSCYPAALALDTDPEAIPYPFTDAVPYFAAYLALMSAQSSARIEQAQQLLSLYKMFVERANKASAPNVNRYIYERQDAPTIIGKLGVQQGGQQ